MAAETGLRRNELKTLHVADLDLADLAHACVNVRATNTKNRREAHLPLRAELAAALRSHIRERLPAARVFTVPKDFRAAVMLRADLLAADIPYEDDAGRVVDFHSLRVTFATNLARGGVALQLAQRLLRHCTPVLTANVYTVLGRDDDRKAIEKLPEVGVGREAESVRATGTDAAPVASPPTQTPRARRSSKQPIDEPPPSTSPVSPSPPDPRLAALISAWSHLDEQARTVLVRAAEVMARG